MTGRAATRLQNFDFASGRDLSVPIFAPKAFGAPTLAAADAWHKRL